MAEPTYQALLEENQRLRQRLAEQDRAIAQLQDQLRELQQRLETAERSAKRPAAPFAKGPPRAHPKRPGRRAGDAHGTHGHRPPPPQVDQTLDAPLPDACPGCGHALVETHLDEQFQTEIPCRPIVRRFVIHCGHCPHCGQRCRGRHPLQTSDAVGAAASQLGPDAQAAVVYLNKHAGLSHGKVADVLGQLCGVTLTRGASAQIVLRAGDRLRPAYQEIREKIRGSSHLTPDETGWRIGGHPVWLHTAVGDEATCYAIDRRRSADVLAGIIGFDWQGVMTHDGLASYDRFTEAIHQQCVAHVLRRARALEEQQAGAAKVFPRQVVELFVGALQVRDQYLEGRLDEAALEQAHARCVGQLLDLTDHRRTNEANDRLAAHLYGHGEQWFMFLIDPTIPATNHRAEQALRGPIVNRKVWGGNRTEAGAEAQAVINSVLQTCKQTAQSALTYLSQTFCGLVSSLFAPPTAR